MEIGTKRYVRVYAAVVVVTGAALHLTHHRFHFYLFPVGSAVLGLALWVFWQQVSFLRGTRKTYGRLVGSREVAASPNPAETKNYSYAQVVFTAADGLEYQITSATGGSLKPKTIGSTIPVRYDPLDPAAGKVATFFDYWGPSLVMMLLGGVAISASFQAVK